MVDSGVQVPIGSLRARLLRTLRAQPALAETFYARLFELQPTIRGLFPSDLAAQQMKFGQTVQTVLQLIDGAVLEPTTSADHPPSMNGELASALANLGARHRDYGALPQHYAAVGEALMAALSSVSQPQLSAEELQAWRRLYAWITLHMLGE